MSPVKSFQLPVPMEVLGNWLHTYNEEKGIRPLWERILPLLFYCKPLTINQSRKSAFSFPLV